jgi:glycerol kinase
LPPDLLQVADSGGVYFVPAFAGLLAPHWQEDARGVLLGMTGVWCVGGEL